jgi:hypothetical protein
VEGSVEFVVDVAFPDASEGGDEENKENVFPNIPFPDASVTFPDASEDDEENNENVFPNIPFPDASVTFPDASVTFPDASEDDEENNENGSKFG